MQNDLAVKFYRPDRPSRRIRTFFVVLFILHIIIIVILRVRHVCLARINSQFTVLAQCVIRDGTDRPRVHNIWLLCFVLIQFIYAHTILICLRTRSCIMYYFICTHISCVIDLVILMKTINKPYKYTKHQLILVMNRFNYFITNHIIIYCEYILVSYYIINLILEYKLYTINYSHSVVCRSVDQINLSSLINSPSISILISIFKYVWSRLIYILLNILQRSSLKDNPTA